MLENENDKNFIECKIHKKLLDRIPLSEKDIELLGTIIKEELKFMIRNNILPFPESYSKWFHIFCYIVENGLNLRDNEIFELYKRAYKEERTDNLLGSVHGVIEALWTVAEDLYNLVKEQKEYSQKKEREITHMKELEVSSKTIENLVESFINHLREIQEKSEQLLEHVRIQRNIINNLTFRIKHLEIQANLDYLTGIHNRRSIERALKEYFEEFLKGKSKFSIMLIDLDEFKQINDRYGHLVGDKVLINVAYAIKSSIRARDILGRWGGDEFLLILPNTNKEIADKIKRRIKDNIENLNIFVEQERIKISVSVGTAEVNEKHKKVEDLLQECDVDLYKDKGDKESS